MSANPFDALGLPIRRDLTDEQVRGAWRRVATATHPDRADGGDLARYTAATAAYVTAAYPVGAQRGLRRRGGRRRRHLPAARGVRGFGRAGRGGWCRRWGCWSCSVRARGSCRPVSGTGGRCGCSSGPCVAALACLGVLAVIPGQPAAPFLVAALVTWFVVTGRSDLAPPRHR